MRLSLIRGQPMEKENNPPMEVDTRNLAAEVDMRNQPGLETYTPHHDYSSISPYYLPAKVEEPSNLPSRPKGYINLKLRRSTVILILLLVLVIIIGAVGGAIGGTQAVKQARSECRSTTPTQASTEPQPSGTVLQTPNNQSAAGPTQTSDSQGTAGPTQTVFKNERDFHGSSTISVSKGSMTWGTAPTIIAVPPAGNSTYKSPGTGFEFDIIPGLNHANNDIVVFLTDVIEVCMEACANRQKGATVDNILPDLQCAGVIWVGTDAAQGGFGNTIAGNCYLKSNVDVRFNADDPSRGIRFWLAAMKQ